MGFPAGQENVAGARGAMPESKGVSLGRLDHFAERERFVDDLLAYMTLEEKAGQLVFHPRSPDPARLGARGEDHGFFDQLRGGLVGAIGGVADSSQAEALQRLAVEESRLGIPLLFVSETASGVGTVMAAPASAAASWDPDAVEAAHRAVAYEARARGTNWALAPEIRLAADCADPAYAGSSGSDPFLATALAVACVRGLQYDSAGDASGLSACLRIAHGMAEIGRHDASARIALDAVNLAGVGSIAVEPAEAQPAGHFLPGPDLLADLLRRPGAYGGVLLADWARLALLSGQEPGAGWIARVSAERLVAAVRGGDVAEALLDDAARRLLALKFDLGLFRQALGRARKPAAETQPAPREAALDLARKSIVLVRNAPALLPLRPDKRPVLIVGAAANNRAIPLAGQPGLAASVVDGLEAAGCPFRFVPGLALRQDGSSGDKPIEADRMAIGMACEAARRSAAVIVVLGGEELGRAKRELIAALRVVNENIGLVTLGARPLDPTFGEEPLACVLHAGQLGTMSGHAIAEVLTGVHAPTGRLPAPLMGESPEASLPFGHGLGYGEFTFSNFALELGADRLFASLDLRNAGEIDGSETVQLYVRRDAGEPLALRGFQRVDLRSGVRRRVTFEIGAGELGEYGPDGRFAIPDGPYEIRLGPDAARLHGGEIVVPAAVALAMRGLRSAGAPAMGGA